MECPVFTAGEEPRVNELKPYSCPLIYCPPNNGIGNYTFSVCMKLVNEVDERKWDDITKKCKTDFDLCEFSCGYLKGESIGDAVKSRYISYNTTIYTAVGCVQGDQSIAQNKSSFFPPSSIAQHKVYPDQFFHPGFGNPTSSSSNQLHITFPWFLLVVALLFTNFMKKI